MIAGERTGRLSFVAGAPMVVNCYSATNAGQQTFWSTNTTFWAGIYFGHHGGEVRGKKGRKEEKREKRKEKRGIGEQKGNVSLL